MDNGQLDDGIEQFDLSTLDEQGVAQLFTQLGFPFYDSQLAGEQLGMVQQANCSL